MAPPGKSALATRLIHADESVPNPRNAVIPPISVTTTYRQTTEEPEARYIYSRVEHPVRERCEQVLGMLEGGHAILYASGLAAIYAAIAYVRPRRILLNSGGYHGTQEIVKMLIRRMGLVALPLNTPAQAGDLLWLETPNNPFCRCEGADIVMHSATKYYGGHSDLLAGVLVVRTVQDRDALLQERTFMGNVAGNLESWLLLRSMRTFELRIQRQCETATRLAAWLSEAPNQRYVSRVWHLSLPSHPDHELAKRQMQAFGPLFSVEMATADYAKRLPELLHLFANATSLGGVESLIDWRYRYDTTVSQALLRISIGVEAFEDLKADLEQAFHRLDTTTTPVAKL